MLDKTIENNTTPDAAKLSWEAMRQQQEKAVLEQTFGDLCDALEKRDSSQDGDTALLRRAVTALLHLGVEYPQSRRDATEEKDETKYGKFRELPIPNTFPKDGSCYAAELLRVVQVLDGEWGTQLGYHMEFEHKDYWACEWQEEWGEHLANLAWKLANDYSEGGFGDNPPASFARICAAFVKAVTTLDAKQLEQAQAMQVSKVEDAG